LKILPISERSFREGKPLSSATWGNLIVSKSESTFKPQSLLEEKTPMYNKGVLLQTLSHERRGI